MFRTKTHLYVFFNLPRSITTGGICNKVFTYISMHQLQVMCCSDAKLAMVGFLLLDPTQFTDPIQPSLLQPLAVQNVESHPLRVRA